MSAFALLIVTSLRICQLEDFLFLVSIRESVELLCVQSRGIPCRVSFSGVFYFCKLLDC